MNSIEGLGHKMKQDSTQSISGIITTMAVVAAAVYLTFVGIVSLFPEKGQVVFTIQEVLQGEERNGWQVLIDDGRKVHFYNQNFKPVIGDQIVELCNFRDKEVATCRNTFYAYTGRKIGSYKLPAE